MSDAKFTKGEWYKYGNGVACGGYAIAVINFDGGSFMTNEEDIANTNLIAAAPEMYKMLVKLNNQGGLGLDRHKRIEELLAKARGEKHE